MHITAVCPACENAYKVQPSLRGQPMRCPNPDCRTVFTVPPEEAPAAPKAAPPRPQSPNGPRSGSVGDIVPLLPAQTDTPTPGSLHVTDVIPLVQAEAVETPAAKATPSWQQPPPVRRPANPTAPSARPTPTPTPAPAPVAKDGPREMPPGKWEPPPVRRGQPAAPPETPVEHAPEEAHAEAPSEPITPDEPIAHPPGRRVGWIVAALAGAVVLVLGGGAALLWWIMVGREAVMAQEAADTYKQTQFDTAAAKYKDLWDQFPTSEKHDSYKLMQDLSDLRHAAAAPDPEMSAVLDKFFDFIESHKEPPQALKERAPDLGETVVHLTEGYKDRNLNTTDEQGPLNVVDRLEKAFKAADALELGDQRSALQDRLAKATGAIRTRVALVKRTRESVARIKEAADAKSPAKRVREINARIKEEKADLPDIDRNPEVVEIVKQVYANHMAGVTYQEQEQDLPPPRRENDEATFRVNAPLGGAPGKAPADDPIKLAVARGVLYALKQTNGETKWAVRVGVDTTALPVRVPATEVSPERILVPSADALTLAALDPEGIQRWEYHLSGQCIGRPLVIGNLAYVPTYDGKVHVIELAQGKLKGVYDLGQPLTAGGARQPETNLLYFPADDFCVYVLDVSENVQRCVAVLYTGHLAGSLRGEPLILTPDPGVGESWLVLNQTHGLDETRMRVYRLPLQDKDQQPEKIDPEPVVPGWTWFPPTYDGEKVAMLGDAGVLGLFGIRQSRNLNDPPLFPMLPKNIDLVPAAAARDRGRSEVVEMQDQDLCVLARGRLQRLSLGLSAAAGPRLEPAAHWEAPALGSPLHASQVEPHPLGGATLYLVTQPLKQQTCLATAVDNREGDILWQRQLGMVCQGEPLELRPPGGAGAPILLTLDRGGGLFAFDPADYTDLADGQWRDGGQNLFKALDDGPGAPPVLLPGPDGQSVYEIASPGDGTRLVVRRVKRNADGLVTTERIVPLTSPLAGTPAVTGTMLLLPLAKGVLARLPLPLAATPVLEEGPNWRSRRAPPDARGRVAALPDGTFLTCDGGRGLTHWEWSAAKAFKAFPAGKAPLAPTLELDNSPTADPVLLPEVKGSPAQLCIADAAGVVTLLTVTGDGGLKNGRGWNLGGRITAGPYVQTLPGGGTRIGCVINETQLVWLDPDADKPLWTHPAKAGAELVGRPQLVGGLVVVADESGLIVGLDPATGKPAKPEEYRLQGSTAPAATPVGFGADRLFVPLSDGTVLLPPMSRIR